MIKVTLQLEELNIPLILFQFISNKWMDCFPDASINRTCVSRARTVQGLTSERPWRQVAVTVYGDLHIHPANRHPQNSGSTLGRKSVDILKHKPS